MIVKRKSKELCVLCLNCVLFSSAPELTVHQDILSVEQEAVPVPSQVYSEVPSQVPQSVPLSTLHISCYSASSGVQQSWGWWLLPEYHKWHNSYCHR
jgi:hypothetical protein